MSLNGKTLLKPQWVDGKAYCKICVQFNEERKPLIILVEKRDYVLFSCPRCHWLYRSPVKTMEALDEIRKIKNLLIKTGAEKDRVKKCRDTWLLCRDIKRELDACEKEIQRFE